MSLRFWGVRGSIPSPSPETTRYGGNTSCIEVRFGDQILILDCGSGLRALGASLNAEFKTRGFNATVLISHTHWDHIQGLPFFAPAYADRNHLRIFSQAGSRTRVHKALNNQMEPMHFPVRFGELAGVAGVDELPKEGKQFGALTVRTMNLNHPGGCAASASQRMAPRSHTCPITSPTTVARCRKRRPRTSRARRRVSLSSCAVATC